MFRSTLQHRHQWIARGLAALLVAAALSAPLAMGVTGPVGDIAKPIESLRSIARTEGHCSLPGAAEALLPATDAKIRPVIGPGVALAPADRYNVGFSGYHGYQVGDSYHGGTVVHVDKPTNFISVSVTGESYGAFRAETTTDENVVYCERDVEYRALFTPNDALFSSGGHYGSGHVKLPQAWDTTLGSTNKQICIVDTGIRHTHQDLAGARWLGGIDHVNNDNDPWDDHGHGTHVAGTAAATTNNGVGVAGASQSGIFAAKVLSASGSGSSSWVASGITWCADQGADVISLSLGSSVPSTAVHNAVKYAYDTKGALVVAAMGNSGPCFNCPSYPAGFDEVIAVNCTDAAKNQCFFSSDGPEAELAAPGSGIISTCASSDTAYCTMSGTSMSTPFVSGVAALVWSAFPSLTNGQLRVILKCSAQDFGPSGWDEFYGHGIVDANNALVKAANGCPGVPPPELQCGAVFAIGGMPIGSMGYTGPTTLDVIHTLDDHVVNFWVTYTVITNVDGNHGVIYTQVGTHPDKWQITGNGANTYQMTAHATLACGVTLTATWKQTN